MNCFTERLCCQATAWKAGSSPSDADDERKSSVPDENDYSKNLATGLGYRDWRDRVGEGKYDKGLSAGVAKVILGKRAVETSPREKTKSLKIA